MAALGATTPDVFARCCCLVREHLQNGLPRGRRLFSNRQGARGRADWRVTLDGGVIADACA